MYETTAVEGVAVPSKAGHWYVGERNKEGEKKPIQTRAPLSKSNGFRLVAVEGDSGRTLEELREGRNVRGLALN